MFIDTNVLVFARFSAAPWHERARRNLERASAGDETPRISRQIVREYLMAVTRPQSWWSTPLPAADAVVDVERFLGLFGILDEGPRVTDLLLALCREFSVSGKQVHDANIVATMLAHGERRLLTFNASDFRRYGPRVELVAPV